MSESNQNQLEDSDDDEEDYSWDYDDDSEEKPKVSKHILISLTRDWLGRENPDAYPTHGFFPVWAFALLIIAGNNYEINKRKQITDYLSLVKRQFFNRISFKIIG